MYCQLAIIKNDYYRTMTDKANAEYYKNLRGWSALAGENLYLWLYSTNFSYYLAPYDCFDSFAESYRLAADLNAFYMFDQRQTDERGVLTGWSYLKSYIVIIPNVEKRKASEKLTKKYEKNQQKLLKKKEKRIKKLAKKTTVWDGYYSTLMLMAQ